MVHVHYILFVFPISSMNLNTDASGGDKEENDNDHIAIPLLMRNALPDVQGYEKNEKTDIAMRPVQVSIVG